MPRAAVLIVAATVWCYWLSVLVMIVRSHRKHRTSAGAVPRTGRERGMWLFWVPTVLAWQVLPIMAYRLSLPLIRAPQWAFDHPIALLDWFAVVAALVAYLLTVPCWLTLGANWSLAVVPNKQTSLITSGWYGRIRHPIYALGLLLMLATVAVSPSPAMLMVAFAHTTLVILKSSGEERHLKQRHGQAYQDYCHRTGRFFPRLLPTGIPNTI
jgi:protein-S-isoprenylcysteine O-methyltransferase Ste14